MPIPALVAGVVIFLFNVAGRLTPLTWSYVMGTSAGTAVTVAVLRPGVHGPRVLAWLAKVLPRAINYYTYRAVMRNGTKIPLEPGNKKLVADFASRVSHIEVEGLSERMTIGVGGVLRSATQSLLEGAKGASKLGAREIDEFNELSHLIVRPQTTQGVADAQHLSRQLYNLIEKFERRDSSKLRFEFFSQIFSRVEPYRF